MREINSEQYLKRIANEKDKLPESEIDTALARLSTPFREVTYGAEGKEKVNVENFSFEFSYSSIHDSSQKEEIDENLRRLQIDQKVAYANPENWRKLDMLIFEVKGKHIDLLDKLPPDTQIFFCPTSAKFHGSVSRPPVRIYILGDITTPRSLVTLLHEAGHVFDDANLEKLGREDMMDTQLNAYRAEKLRTERSASAFAFKAIKSVVPEGQLRNDARTFLKSYALESYQASIKADVAHDAMMSHHLRSEYDYYMVSPREDEERARFDDFEKWRKTNAFKKWKETPDYANLKEYSDEYIAWSRWVEETGHDYYKDIYPEAGESI